MEEFDVRAASEFVPAAALSGGNQQKAIIAREIDRDPDLLIVSQQLVGWMSVPLSISTTLD